MIPSGSADSRGSDTVSHAFLLPPGSEPLLEYVNVFIAKERESGRLDELAEIYLRGRRP